ncbi:MAG: mechanosensitive ion channel family protein [Synechococcus sp.]
MRPAWSRDVSTLVRWGLMLLMLVSVWTVVLPQPSVPQPSVPQTLAQQPSNPITESLSDLASPILDGFDAPLDTRWVSLDGRRVLLVAASTVSGDNDSGGSASPVYYRAKEIERKLKDIARDVVRGTLSLDVTHSTTFDNSPLRVIKVGGRYLMTVTTQDAQIWGEEDPNLAAIAMSRQIRNALNRAVEERTSLYLRTAGLRAAGIAVGSVALAWLVSRLRFRVRHYYDKQLDGFAEPSIIPQQTNTVEATDVPEEIDEDLEAERAAARQRWQEQKSRTQFRRDFINLAFQVIRVVLLAAGCLAILRLFPQTRYLGTGFFHWFTAFALELFLIILFTYTAFRLSLVAINGLFSNLSRGQFLKGGTSIRLSSRLKTVSGVLKSLIGTIIISIGVLAFLAAIHIDLAPILAGAGLIGLAVSFASQSLVKDFLNGFFILLEDQFSEGDVIAIGGFAGVVEDLNLRRTRLRSADGNLIVVPNSTIAVVENLTNGFSRANLGIEVAYDTDLDFAIATIKQVADNMAHEPEWQSLIVKEPEMLGVDSFGDNSITIRLWIDTQPLKQWAVAREFRRRLKYAFDRGGISIPFPQRSIWFETPLKTQGESLSESEIQRLIEQQKRTNSDRSTEFGSSL